jgi:hypothetical protein
MWRRTSSIALIALATIGVAAQGKPDFSGRWVLAGPQRPGAVVRQTVVRATVQGDPMDPFFRDITIERQSHMYRRS